jgi:hypothetical protein
LKKASPIWSSSPHHHLGGMAEDFTDEHPALQHGARLQGLQREKEGPLLREELAVQEPPLQPVLLPPERGDEEELRCISPDPAPIWRSALGMTPQHGKTPAILYTKAYSTDSGTSPLPSPSGIAVGRGSGPARSTGVDSQGERAERARKGRETSGKRAFGLDPLVPASIWAGTKGPATSPQNGLDARRLWSRPITTL